VPMRVDCSGFCISSPQITAERGAKIVQVTNAQKGVTTIMSWYNVTGNFIPLFMVLKGKERSRDSVMRCHLEEWSEF
jgi:hypothetical protein